MCYCLICISLIYFIIEYFGIYMFLGMLAFEGFYSLLSILINLKLKGIDKFLIRIQ